MACAALALAPTLRAQTVLTLDDAVSAALSNNLSLRRADADVRAATEQRREAFTKYFPTVSATGTGIGANEHLIKMDLGGMGLNLIKHGITADVSLLQPVYAGGRIAAGNRLARVGEEVSTLQRALTADEVRLTAETYYRNIVLLKEKLRTIGRLEQQVDRAEEDARAAVDAGVRNRNDLLQVQLRRGEVRTARLQAENALATVRDLLAQYIGATAPVDVADTVLARPADPAALRVDAATAVAGTKEYGLLEKQVEAERLNYKMTRGENLPSVAVGGVYAYNNLLDKSANKLVGMVTLSVPISSWWGGSHAMKRQRIKVENAENTLRDNGELLAIRIRKGWTDLTEAYQRTLIAEESVEQSEENLRLNTDYYRAGTAPVGDLLDAQTLYQKARDAFAEAVTQYEIKKREYLQMTGR